MFFLGLRLTFHPLGGVKITTRRSRLRASEHAQRCHLILQFILFRLIGRAEWSDVACVGCYSFWHYDPSEPSGRFGCVSKAVPEVPCIPLRSVKGIFLSFFLCSNLFREGFDDIENSLANLFFLQFWGSCWGYAGMQHPTTWGQQRPSEWSGRLAVTRMEADRVEMSQIGLNAEEWKVPRREIERPLTMRSEVDWCLIDVFSWFNVITEGPGLFVPGSVSNLLPFLNMLKGVCLSFCSGFVRQQLTEKEDLLQAALEAKARFYPVLPRFRHLSSCIPPLAPLRSGSCRGRAKAIISSYRRSRERPKNWTKI